MSTVVEFEVQMTCGSCVTNIENSLRKLRGIEKVNISLENGSVIVESSLPSSVIQETIESTGRRAVLKGYGGSIAVGLKNTSAVAMIGGPVGFSINSIQGIVRLVQVDPNTCVIEGTIDGLETGEHGLHIHECGDISQGCQSVGDHFSLMSSTHGGPLDEPEKRHTGDLGNIEADENGRARFRLLDNLVKVHDVIGRSLVVTEHADDLGKGSALTSAVDGNSGLRLACGIISRSSGIFENTKRICACDGVTLWDERDRPLAGPGRRATTSAL